MNLNFTFNQYLYVVIFNQVSKIRNLTIKINIKTKGYSKLLL
jgi:hypothetical protein